MNWLTLSLLSFGLLGRASSGTGQTAPPAGGSFRIFCGVPGHGLSGMWIRFKVDPGAKAPSFQATKSS